MFSDAPLWTSDNANELLQRFVQSPIEGGDLSFFEKFEQQLSSASPGSKKLAAEMLWLLYLFPSDMKGKTKRDHVQRIWEWSREPLDLTSPWLGDALDRGIGAANPGLSNYRPNELALIVTATHSWRNLTREERMVENDCWAFGNWCDSLDASKGRQFRHIWLYLMFPDEYEPISSENHKQRLVRHYKNMAGVSDELRAIEGPADSDRVRADKTLLAIHGTLQKSLGRPFSFYEPEIRAEWSPPATQPDASMVAATHPIPVSNVKPEIEPDSVDLGGLFIEPEEFAILLRTLEREKNLILQGPPGVGKTFIAKQLAETLAGGRENVAWVQFHESYSYEDFIRGYRPDGSAGFSLEDGIFFRFNQRALNSKGKFVFVIDEINRGKLSKILGELLMCIESDKRGPRWGVQLAYRKTSDEPLFFVAPNLYVIGLMNTADRSLAVVDYALRRRFSFHTLRPMFAAARFRKFLSEEGVSDELLEVILDKIRRLNEEIEKELGAGFQIGHSYFCPQHNEEPDENWYLEVIRSHIEPLLEEYWFDNPARARGLSEMLRLP